MITREDMYKFRISNNQPKTHKVSQAQLDRKRARDDIEAIHEQRKFESDFNLECDYE